MKLLTTAKYLTTCLHVSSFWE